jgi:hypothetical protein
MLRTAWSSVKIDASPLPSVCGDPVARPDAGRRGPTKNRLR